MNSSLPLVTCLCLTTKNRHNWLPRAVRCFREQDYPNKELLIVADSWSDAESVMDGPWREWLSYCSAPGKNIGQKRNLGNGWASGDFICAWDDDDWSEPGRLSQQVHDLQSPLAVRHVTGYSSMKFTDGERWWNFRCGAGFVVGSSLCYRRDWALKHPFAETQIGEEGVFCDEAFRAGVLLEVPDLNIMFCSIHEGNTSKRDLSKPEWTALPRDFRFPRV